MKIDELPPTKKVIAWGGDITLMKSIETCAVPIHSIVDNNPKKWGSAFAGCEINPPERLTSEDARAVVIIIFCFQFVEISKQLDGLGFEYGKNYFHFLDFDEFKPLIDRVNEEADYRFLDNTIQPGWTCLDIGANCGLFTYKLARLTGREGRVYSFEPLPTAFRELNRIRSIYRLSNVQTFNVALVDSPDISSARMIIPEVNDIPRSGLAHLEERRKTVKDTREIFPAAAFKKLFGNELSQEALRQGRGIKVACTTLDSFARTTGMGKVDFIKIDTEGAEFFVLNGGKELIRRSRPLIQVELGFSYFGSDTVSKVVTLLETMDYSFCYLDSGRFRPIDRHELVPGEHNYYFVQKPAS